MWYNQVGAWFALAGHRINRYLQKRIEGWSPWRLKAACLLFVLLAGGGSTWVLMNALNHPSAVMQITPIHAPAAAASPDLQSLPYDAQTQASINRIRAFRLRMDSLKNDPEGRRLYDSLRQARPGLFDSIEMVEQLYRHYEKDNQFFNK